MDTTLTIEKKYADAFDQKSQSYLKMDTTLTHATPTLAVLVTSQSYLKMDTTLTEARIKVEFFEKSQSYLKMDTTLTVQNAANENEMKVSILPKNGYHSDLPS